MIKCAEDYLICQVAFWLLALYNNYNWWAILEKTNKLTGAFTES